MEAGKGTPHTAAAASMPSTSSAAGGAPDVADVAVAVRALRVKRLDPCLAPWNIGSPTVPTIPYPAVSAVRVRQAMVLSRVPRVVSL